MNVPTRMGYQVTTPPKTVWPEIHLDRATIHVGRSRECDVVLAHPSVSRHHAIIESTPSGLLVTDTQSRAGTFVNGMQVSRQVIRMGDHVRFGYSSPYRYEGQSLVPVPEALGMSLKLVKVGVKRYAGGGERFLIRNVNIDIPANSFTAVLGPSGAGKTVLMDCLSSNQHTSEGLMTFDGGIPINQETDYFRSKTGVISQDDLVYLNLTVEENLLGAARLRFPPAERSKIGERIELALDAVDLIKKKKDPAVKLSGGERKRLSIAIELISRPRLLLLDEPTSGLDPGRAAKLMETLRRLSQQGVTVICVTHTLDTLNFFDSVIVLGKVQDVSTVVYHGTPQELLPAFKVNTQADLFDKLTGSNLMANSSSSGHSLEQEGSTTIALRPSRTGARPRAASQFVQTLVVSGRSFVELWRDPSTRLLALVQPPVLAALITLSQRNLSASIFLQFYLVLAALWLGMTLTVREIVRERNLYRRDRLAGLRPGAYLGGKILFGALASMGQAILLCSIARWIAPHVVRHAVAEHITRVPYLLEYLVLWAITFGGAVIGLMLSTIAASERTAVALLPLVLLPQMLFSRASFGDGLLPWSVSSPYSPIAIFMKSYRDKYVVPASKLTPLQLSASGVKIPPGSTQPARTSSPSPSTHSHLTANALISTFSLLMLTRPGTASIDMRSYPDIKAAWERDEQIYLSVLILFYGSLLWGLFTWREQGWRGAR